MTKEYSDDTGDMVYQIGVNSNVCSTACLEQQQRNIKASDERWIPFTKGQ